MIMKKVLLQCLTGIALLAASCSSSTDENGIMLSDYGTIELGVKANTGFQANARAVTESEYTQTDNYTVQILQDDAVKQSFTYSKRPEKITLPNGSYVLKAFYGTETEASRDKFLMTGSTPFTIQGKDQAVTVDCKPTCGKLVVKFATAEMDKFFNDYYVVYETEALKAKDGNATWAKADTEPWYVKLNPAGEEVKATIHYVRTSDGKQQTQAVTYTMKPDQKWTLNIKPKNDSGDLGIDITIDESTNDKDITIDIPSEWL